MKTYGLAAAIGFILGIGLVYWVRPDTDAGAVLIVVTATLICFVAGAAVRSIVGLFTKE